MIETLPLTGDDVAVTHLRQPGDVCVSTRAVTHIDGSGRVTVLYQTAVLIHGGKIEGPSTPFRDLACGQHVGIVAALLAGAPLTSIGRIDIDEQG